MNDVPDTRLPPATDLQALVLSDREAHALLDRIRKRCDQPAVPAGLLGLSGRRTRQLALLAATIAFSEAALIAVLPGMGTREPLEHALGTTLLEGRPLTPRDVYLLHLWGKP
jgi:hypothetical protein